MKEVFRTGLSFELNHFIDIREEVASMIASETIFNCFYRQPFKYGQQISSMLSMFPRSETIYTNLSIMANSYKYAMWFAMIGHYPGRELLLQLLNNVQFLLDKRNFENGIVYLYFQADVFLTHATGTTIASSNIIDRCFKAISNINWEKYFAISLKGQPKDKLRSNEIDFPTTSPVTQLPLDYSQFYYALAQLGLYSKHSFTTEELFSITFKKYYFFVIRQPVLTFGYDSLMQFFIFHDLTGIGSNFDDFWPFEIVRNTVNETLNQSSDGLKSAIEQAIDRSVSRQRWYIHKRLFYDPFHCLQNGDDYKTIYKAKDAENLDESIHVKKPDVRPAMAIKDGKIDSEDFLLEFVDTKEFTRVFHPSMFQQEFQEALKAQEIAFEKNVFIWPYLFDFVIDSGEKKWFIDVEDEYKKYWNFPIYYPEERAKEKFCEKEKMAFKRVSSAEFLRNRLRLKDWLATLEVKN